MYLIMRSGIVLYDKGYTFNAVWIYQLQYNGLALIANRFILHRWLSLRQPLHRSLYVSAVAPASLCCVSCFICFDLVIEPDVAWRCMLVLALSLFFTAGSLLNEAERTCSVGSLRLIVPHINRCRAYKELYFPGVGLIKRIAKTFSLTSTRTFHLLTDSSCQSHSAASSCSIITEHKDLLQHGCTIRRSQVARTPGFCTVELAVSWSSMSCHSVWRLEFWEGSWMFGKFV